TSSPASSPVTSSLRSSSWPLSNTSTQVGLPFCMTLISPRRLAPSEAATACRGVHAVSTAKSHDFALRRALFLRGGRQQHGPFPSANVIPLAYRGLKKRRASGMQRGFQTRVQPLECRGHGSLSSRGVGRRAALGTTWRNLRRGNGPRA